MKAVVSVIVSVCTEGREEIHVLTDRREVTTSADLVDRTKREKPSRETQRLVTQIISDLAQNLEVDHG